MFIITIDFQNLLFILLPDPPGALEGAKNVMVLDHRLTTDEDLLADLKYLFEDYRYKKKLVLDPQPELNYYILFVK